MSLCSLFLLSLCIEHLLGESSKCFGIKTRFLLSRSLYSIRETQIISIVNKLSRILELVSSTEKKSRSKKGILRKQTDRGHMRREVMVLKRGLNKEVSFEQ